MAGVNQVTCERRTYSGSPHVHAHEYSQLILPIQGALSLSFYRESCCERKDQVVYIPPHCSHSFYADQTNRFFVFDIPAGFFPGGKAEFKRVYDLDERWKAMRVLIGSEVGEGELEKGYRITDLCRYMIGCLEQPALIPSQEYIQRNYQKKITLQELAEIEHYHPSYFCEWFRERVGQTPMDYTRKLRLDRAKKLLAEGEHSLLWIAQEVGYENQATLTKLLKKHLGISPRDYRRQHMETKE